MQFQDIKNGRFYLGDCLEVMKEIPDGVVDMILCDPPYGTVKNAPLDGWKEGETHWDEVLNMEEVFNQCDRILRQNGALVLFSQDPFTYELFNKQHGNLPFAYRLTWLKNHFANPLFVKKAPVNYTEDIMVFFKKYDSDLKHDLRDYCANLFKFINKTKKELFEEMGHQGVCHFLRFETMQFSLCTEKTYNELINLYKINEMEGFVNYEILREIDLAFKRKFERIFNLGAHKKKSNVLEFSKDSKGFHPTQKPVALFQDLIQTYTNEGCLICDFTAGSGTTAIAAENTGRKWVCIEQNEEYATKAVERIQNHQPEEKPTSEVKIDSDIPVPEGEENGN